MADINLKTSTPDTSLPTTGFLFGADSQAASAPSVFTTQAVATTLLGSTTLSGATITTSQPVLDLSQTWNASAVTFTGLKYNATDTASAAASLLMDLQVGGSSRFGVRKDGSAYTSSSATFAHFIVNSNGGGFACNNSGLNDNTYEAIFTGYRLCLANSVTIDWASTGTVAGTVPTGDLILSRRAAANLRLGAADAAAPVAQTLSVQSGTAGASALSCSISGTTLTVGGAVTGTIAIGHAVTGTGVSAGTVITAGSGTTWTVNNSQTVSSTTMYFNSVGQNLTITGSQGSGPSSGGSIVFQVAPAGAAATTAQNALADALTITSARAVTVAGAFTVANGSGAVITGGMKDASSNDTTSVGWNVGVIAVNSTGRFEFSNSTTSSSGAGDVRLFRDAANTLALRNGANAQTFRVYNTTDGTNSEFANLYWAGNTAYLLTAQAGTGSNRNLAIGTAGGSATLTFWTNGVERWRVDGSGHFIAVADNTYDIGASGGTRPRNIYLAGSVVASNGVQVGNSNTYAWANGSYLFGGATTGAVSGAFRLVGSGSTTTLNFGGDTSSFPALKRSSTTLQARLADDSAFAGFASANMQAATAYTVATLPGTPGTGMIARVTDALAPTIGMTVTGGGAAYALVNYNGANWTVIGV